ncbi:hypothetical protein DUI87_22742 [Hirundo rustica rustica]|uniref:Uncharacterized protein n=1 Tax=Hirundo rustica rustica TaxID=333673 RepID=A0A3M0JJ65_HIRRU|nr:hypothetical protein DUI87_22742 [Hirundo rustica rustica]
MEKGSTLFRQGRRITVVVDEGGATYITYLNLCRALGTVLYSTFVYKEERHGSDTLWVKSLLDGIVVTDSMSKWRLVAKDVAQRSELEPALTPLSVTWTGISRASSEISDNTKVLFRYQKDEIRSPWSFLQMNNSISLRLASQNVLQPSHRLHFGIVQGQVKEDGQVKGEEVEKIGNEVELSCPPEQGSDRVALVGNGRLATMNP